MPDLLTDPKLPDTDLVAAPACCPGGACGPIFETPLLELAFNRLRDMVGGQRPAERAAPTAGDPLPGLLSTVAPAVPARTAHPQEDASHD
jgi:hypothetical protein